MRPFAFYLAVALLAFGMGSAAVYYYYQPEKTVNDSKLIKRDFPLLVEQDFPLFSLPHRQEKKLTPRRDKFLTDKEKASILFEPTINKWLDKQKIENTIEPSSEIIQKITEEEFLYADYSELKRNAEAIYKPSLIDVNGDGKDELAILSNCSEEKSCQFWILKQSNKDFEVILSSYQEVDSFKLQKNKIKGYFNIEIFQSYPNSQTSLGMNIYKFDGKEYYIFDCFDYEFRYEGKDGKLHNLKKPKLRPVHCC